MAKRKRIKGQNKDLQNTPHKTKDQVTRVSLKTSGELGCSGRVSSSVKDAYCTAYISAAKLHWLDIFSYIRSLTSFSGTSCSLERRQQRKRAGGHYWKRLERLLFCYLQTIWLLFWTVFILQDKHNIRILSEIIWFICTRCETGQEISPEAHFSVCF